MTLSGRPSGTDHKKPALREEIAPALVGVQARFLALIVDRILMFEALKKDIETGRDPENALGMIAELAHKIAGVAGTLGYPHAGDLAARVEQAARKGQATMAAPHQTLRDLAPVLDALLDDLEILIAD